MTSGFAFLKNSEVKDEFKARGLAEAKEVLDFTRLDKDTQYGYNSYLDYLHVKASETLSWQVEAAEKTSKDKNCKKVIGIARSLLQTSLSNEDIARHTKPTVAQIEQLRNEKN